MTKAVARAAAAGAAALILCLAGCSDQPKPSEKLDPAAMKQQAEQQRQMHEKLRQRP